MPAVRVSFIIFSKAAMTLRLYSIWSGAKSITGRIALSMGFTLTYTGVLVSFIWCAKEIHGMRHQDPCYFLAKTDLRLLLSAHGSVQLMSTDEEALGLCRCVGIDGTLS